MDLFKLVGKPLLAGELVLLQGEDQLLVVLHSIPGDQHDDDGGGGDSGGSDGGV